MSALPRISGRLGNVLDLNITFYRDGVPTDPYAIRKVSIYRSAVQEENLVAQFLITDPDNPLYPSPLQRELESGEIGKCGTVPPPGSVKPGVFHLFWDVPKEGIPVPDIFFDVWSYIPTPPTAGHCPHHPHHEEDEDADDPIIVGEPDDEEDDGDDEATGVTEENDDCEVVTEQEDAEGDPIKPAILIPGGTDNPLFDDEDQWIRCCNRFWLYADGFVCDDGLENIRLGFEAMDAKFNQPEVRMLEVGMMPLPLYDFDFNRVAPMLPRLRATFTLVTDSCETLIQDEPMKIGLRQGTYRSNPFTLQYVFNSARVLKGSYRYQITVHLPNGETRVSPKFNIQVS